MGHWHCVCCVVTNLSFWRLAVLSLLLMLRQNEAEVVTSLHPPLLMLPHSCDLRLPSRCTWPQQRRKIGLCRAIRGINFFYYFQESLQCLSLFNAGPAFLVSSQEKMYWKRPETAGAAQRPGGSADNPPLSQTQLWNFRSLDRGREPCLRKKLSLRRHQINFQSLSRTFGFDE